ncbi:MAG: DUF3302 domain-containing protein [Proteobacteria bacterium]|nr:DUF3302 domain-containing protein [Pseudomonadota bacterium]
MLDYFALGLLFFVGIVIFYGIIAIHDIPYEIAKARNHPQQDALHVAGWISLFTLHAIWPFLWIWATLYREDRGWGFIKDQGLQEQINLLQTQVNKAQELQEKILALDKKLYDIAQNNTHQNTNILQKIAQLENEIASVKLQLTQVQSKKDPH